jgi:hypothetical protein
LGSFRERKTKEKHLPSIIDGDSAQYVDSESKSAGESDNKSASESISDA